MTFVTHDSGERVEFASGMRRDADAAKPRYDLIPTMPIRRLAELYARGAAKYGDSNWALADTPAEARRFRASAERHFMQWKAGDVDGEDHAIAAVWNIFAALVIEEKLGEPRDERACVLCHGYLFNHQEGCSPRRCDAKFERYVPIGWKESEPSQTVLCECPFGHLGEHCGTAQGGESVSWQK